MHVQATYIMYSFMWCLNIMFKWNCAILRPILCMCTYTSGPGIIVGIVTGYGLDGAGIESQWGRDFLLLSKPALVPTQPPVQWVSGLSRGQKSGRGVTLTPHHLQVPRSREIRAIPLLPLWAVQPVQSLSAYTRVHFTFFLYTHAQTYTHVCAHTYCLYYNVYSYIYSVTQYMIGYREIKW